MTIKLPPLSPHPSQQHPASPHRKETNMMHKSGRNDTQNPGANVPYSSQKTLADYIALKQESDNFFEKKKLTFEEWWQANCSHGFWVHSSQECPGYRDALRIWKAAQENV